MIDLRSDTVTQPSKGMRQAMATAPVGDDVLREDPSVNNLEAVAAELLGKEAALLVPSGTMANLVAFLAQTRPADSVILSELSHPYRFEGANLARFGGLLTKPVPGDDGKLTPDHVTQRVTQVDDPHISPTTLVAIENTTNLGGGTCYTPEEVVALGACCEEQGLRLHCDGARLFNAAVALKTTVATLTAPCDSVSFCLSKGLGAPVGSILAGTATMIHEARRVRKQLGGGMRQAGILAAAGLYALEHHIDDLAEDHRRAHEFRQRLEGSGIHFPRPTQTNIVLVTSPHAEADVKQLAQRGVQVFHLGAHIIRAVFHRNITDEDLDHAAQAFEIVLTG